jgi:uncharacterized RDD family membrane protein YckC
MVLLLGGVLYEAIPGWHHGSIEVSAAGFAAAAAGYEILCVWRFGQTVGKRVVRIAVVTAGGARPSFVQSVLRYAVKTLQPLVALGRWFAFPTRLAYAFAGMLWEVVLLVSIVSNGERRAIHDNVAGTWVVDIRPRRTAALRKRRARARKRTSRVLEAMTRPMDEL